MVETKRWVNAVDLSGKRAYLRLTNKLPTTTGTGPRCAATMREAEPATYPWMTADPISILIVYSSDLSTSPSPLSIEPGRSWVFGNEQASELFEYHEFYRSYLLFLKISSHTLHSKHDWNSLEHGQHPEWKSHYWNYLHHSRSSEDTICSAKQLMQSMTGVTLDPVIGEQVDPDAFLNDLYAKDASGDRKAIRGLIFNWFEDRYCAGEFKRAGELLSRLDVDKLSIRGLICILSATLIPNMKSEFRSKFFWRAHKKILKERPDQIENLLEGLE